MIDTNSQPLLPITFNLSIRALQPEKLDFSGKGITSYAHFSIIDHLIKDFTQYSIRKIYIHGTFQRYCREQGFDLSYFSSKISGTRKEIGQHQFDDFQVIKLIKHTFAYTGIPYSVAEW